MRNWITLCFLLMYIYSNAQTPQFTQYWLDKIGTNPAIVGDDLGINLNTVARTQWTGITSSFNTYNAMVDVYLPVAGGWGFGLGANALSNVEGEGAMRTEQYDAAISCWKIFGRGLETSIGMRWGSIQKRITDKNGLIFSDQLDPVNGAIYKTNYQFKNTATDVESTASLGAAIRIFYDGDQKRRGPIAFSRNILIGFSHTLVNPTLSFYDNSSVKVPKKTVIHGSINITNGNSRDFDQVIYQPYLVYINEGKMWDDSDFNSMTVGSKVIIRQVQFFSAFRLGRIDRIGKIYHRDAVVAGTSFAVPLAGKSREAKSVFNFTYAIDLPVNGIGVDQSIFTHEFGLCFKWKGWRYGGYVMNSQGHRRGKKKCPAYF
jgi:type IX secretion system PorP/SprF family membrane protein